MTFLKKNFTLNINQFSKLSYFCKRGNYVIHNSGYQHKVFNEEKGVHGRFSMGMGQQIHKEFYFFYEDWLNSEEVKIQNIFLWENIEKIEVELDRKEIFFRSLFQLQNNFPRKITFTTKNQKKFRITFKENGLLEKIENDLEKKIIATKMEKDFCCNPIVFK